MSKQCNTGCDPKNYTTCCVSCDERKYCEEMCDIASDGMLEVGNIEDFYCEAMGEAL